MNGLENFDLIDDRILIKPIKMENVKGHREDAEENKIQSGEIIKIGCGIISSELVNITELMKEGDIAYHGLYAGEEITIDNVKFLIVQRSDIMGVWKR